MGVKEAVRKGKMADSGAKAGEAKAVGALIGGYESSNEEGDEGEEGDEDEDDRDDQEREVEGEMPPVPEDEPPPPPMDQPPEVGSYGGNVHEDRDQEEDAPDKQEEEEEKKRLRRLKVEEWKRKRAAEGVT